jgi:hypothetical protein
MAVQQRAVDWFDFWLNGHEDPDERKVEQYAGWRKLRLQHQAGQVQAEMGRGREK